VSKFFHFSQNNSGGSYDFNADKGITHHVIVEAENAADANRRAEEIGLYFDGEGDCPCCGNRWSDQFSDEEGTEAPEVYGDSLEEVTPGIVWRENKPEIAVHYLNQPFKFFEAKGTRC
jgi:hypothetical protein